jgi:hypothetical protein
MRGTVVVGLLVTALTVAAVWGVVSSAARAQTKSLLCPNGST